MPEILAFPSHKLPMLPEPPSEEVFRDYKRMPLDCCRDIIYGTACEIDEIEDAVPIFKLSRDKNLQVDLLKFTLDNVLVDCTDDNDGSKFVECSDELHVYEDIFYITAVKIFNLYSDLKIRFANGFIQPDTLLVTGVTAASMLDLLWQRWGAIFDLEVLATLNFAVRKEHLFAFKTEHNAAVFLGNKSFKQRYTKPRITVSIRRALNRYAFNEAELSSKIKGLQKLNGFNPAAFAAHVQQKNRAALDACNTMNDALGHLSNDSPSPCPSPAPARKRHDSMDLDVEAPNTNTINTTSPSLSVGLYGFSEGSSLSPRQSFIFSETDRFLAGISTQAPPSTVTTTPPWLTPSPMHNGLMGVTDPDAEEERDEMEVDQSVFIMDSHSNQDSNDSHMDFVLQPTVYNPAAPASTQTEPQIEYPHADAAKNLDVADKLKELAGLQQTVGSHRANAALRKQQFIRQTLLDLVEAKTDNSGSLTTTPSSLYNQAPSEPRPRMQLLAPTIYGVSANNDNVQSGLFTTFGLPATPTTSKAKPLQRSLDNKMTAPSETATQHLHDQTHNAGRLERHRGRALLKLEGKLAPNVDMKAWDYGGTCECRDNCSCAYWCRKEPWHMCSCQRPAARVCVRGPLEDDAISIASTIEDELWHTWEGETGRRRWW